MNKRADRICFFLRRAVGNWLLLSFALCSPVADAYIDPMAGSFLSSLIFSLVVSVLHYFYKLKGQKTSLGGVHQAGKASSLKKFSLMEADTGFAFLPQIQFSLKQWTANQKKVLVEIAAFLNDKPGIIRSSAADEDALDSSHAGSYSSVVVLNPKDTKSLWAAIERVFQSMGNNKKNSVLVQEYLEKCEEAGVLTSRAFNFWNYSVLAREELPSNTAGVTSGKSSRVKHYAVFREANGDKKVATPPTSALTPIENHMSWSSVNMEYVSKDQATFALQIRPSPLSENAEAFGPLVNRAHIDEINLIVDKELGSVGALSRMSDWNPVEILGLAPGLFANSLFEDLITRGNWAQARKDLGFGEPALKELTVAIGGDLYVRLRPSLESLIPRSVPSEISKVHIEKRLQEICENPWSHDQIEFNLACSQASLFKTHDVESIQPLLREHSYTIASNYLSNFGSSPDKILKLDTIEDIHDIWGTCYSTAYKFCRAARCAFMSRSWLFEIEKTAPHLKSEIDEMLGLCTRLSDDLFKSQLIGSGVFSYQPREFGFSINSRRANQNLQTDDHFKDQYQSVVNRTSALLKDAHVELFGDRKDWLSEFMVKSIRDREFLKRVLLFYIDDYCNRLDRFFYEKGVGCEVLKNYRHQELSSALKNYNPEFFCENAFREHEYQIQKQIWKPDLFFPSSSLYFFELPNSKGHFILDSSVEGEPLEFDIDFCSSVSSLEGKILILDRGEPGLDWIFAKKPLGIITRYGGPNSHLALRCYESKTQAVLGLSEVEINNLKRNRLVRINGRTQTVEAVNPL